MALAASSDEIAAGRLEVAPGVSFCFAGSYENQVRSEQRLGVLIPVALLALFVVPVLYAWVEERRLKQAEAQRLADPPN